MIIENYITSGCLIGKHGIYKNEELLYTKSESNLPDFFLAAYRHFELNYPKFHKMDNLSKLGWLATEVLLKDSFPASKYEAKDIGVVLSNASSSLDTDIKYFESTKEMASPALFVYTLPNIVIGEICIRHHFKGENAFFIFEKFDAEFMRQYVSNLLNNNILQACICGWVELLDNEYKTVLFLIEKKITSQQLLFTKENINKIYESENG